MEYLAHISGDGRTQTVSEHLHNVADLSSRFADSFGASAQGYLIGMAHDIGKCSAAFKQRLRDGKTVAGTR